MKTHTISVSLVIFVVLFIMAFTKEVEKPKKQQIILPAGSSKMVIILTKSLIAKGYYITSIAPQSVSTTNQSYSQSDYIIIAEK